MKSPFDDGKKHEEDLHDEVREHLEMAKRDRMERGESEEDAERAVRREFGNVELVKETARDQWRWRWLAELAVDARFGLRMLTKNPGFTLVAVLTLALGIGANTAIFSVVDSVLLRPLPFHEPQRLLWLNGNFTQSDQAAVSTPDFVDYRRENRTFEQLVAMGYMTNPSNLSTEKPEQVMEGFASANFFDGLGVHPKFGRDFVAADEQVRDPQVVILGYGLWRGNFGGNPDIVGKTVRLDGQDLTVVGVLPHDLPLLTDAQLWVPMPLQNPGMQVRVAHFLKVIGRMKAGTTPQQTQADTDAIALGLAREYPTTNQGWSLRQRPLQDVLIGPVRPALLVILAAVAVLLLIVCVNVANLLLARSLSRRKEFGMRAALGATRGRLIRQTLTESVMLSTLGAGLGVLLAIFGIGALRVFGPASLPRLNEVHINGGVLAFTAGLALTTGLFFGLIPALQVSQKNFASVQKEFGRGSTPGKHKRVSSILVVAEIAFSMALVVSAGLLLKSFWRLVHVDPGFRAEHVLTARLSLGGDQYKDDAHKAAFFEQLEQRVAELPGVQGFGATSELPLAGEHNDSPFYIEGRSYAASEFDDANFHQVTAGYLAAMRIPLLEGRMLDAHDKAGAAGAIVVNAAFAKKFFPNADALHKRVQAFGDPQKTREIVGIVGNTSDNALADSQGPEMYVPIAQFPGSTVEIVVRTSGNPESTGGALRRAVTAIDKDETLSNVRSMDEVLETSVAQPRFSSQLLGFFALVALFLSAIGLYGLLAYSVTQRTSEIGVRLALGASRGDICRMTIFHGLRLAGIGVALGLLGAFGATRFLQNMLYGISAADVPTFVSVALVLLVVSLLATYLPARRAMRVDPIVALRYE
ncbi:MAG TPA: ABC transporter permease [Candidatus Acidoferrum sp.]|jgi:putative ABC transport system permease protein